MDALCININILFFFSESTKSTILEDDSELSRPIQQCIDHYKYPLELIPIFEAFYLRLETHYKNIVHSKYFSDLISIGDENAGGAITSQMADISRTLLFIPKYYVSVVEEPLKNHFTDREFFMIWFSQIMKHARSFSTFSFKKYLLVQENSDVASTEKRLPTEVRQPNLVILNYHSKLLLGQEILMHF